MVATHRASITAACFFVSSLLSATSVNVPVSEPIYEYLDRLESYNCAYSTNRIFGPQSHEDLIATVYVSQEADRCAAPEWLLKERQILTRPLYPVRIENRSVSMADDFISLSGTSAGLAPIFPGREGRRTVAGFTNGTEILVQSSTQAKRIGISLGVRPGVAGFVPQGAKVNGRFYLQEGYVKLGYGWSELTYGRVGLRFGQTKHGSLLFSPAAAPVDLLKYTLRPVVPSFAKFLGPVSFQTWWGRQDDRGLSGGGQYWALQLALRPFHWLELGWTELFQFGGNGVPRLGIGDLASMALYLNSPKLEARRTRSMATHIGIWLPHRTVKIYGQTLFQNLHSSDDFSYLVGLWFPRLGNTQVRLEWVATAKSPYQQTLYANGLSYEGTPFGHPLGPAGRGLYLDAEFLLWDGWRLETGIQYESRGRGIALLGGGVPETRWGGTLGTKKRWWAMDVEAQVSYMNVTNAGYRPSILLDAVGGSAKVTYSFL